MSLHRGTIEQAIEPPYQGILLSNIKNELVQMKVWTDVQGITRSEKANLKRFYTM